jgi:hypothetical protein
VIDHGQYLPAEDPDADIIPLLRDGAPNIYTSQGNLPLAALDYQVSWEDTPEHTKMIERHWYKGELVREAAHVRIKTSQLAEVTIG